LILNGFKQLVLEVLKEAFELNGHSKNHDFIAEEPRTKMPRTKEEIQRTKNQRSFK
jgi:hypothetical protein